MTDNETSSKGKEVESPSSPSSSKPNPKRASSSAQPSDEVHKQSFSINDLSADFVTLYPFQAAIERNIENVQLKPGRNEITITDLTTWADENSIKIEGKGDAVISDMTVDRMLRASDDESESESDSESESEEESEEESDESESEDEATKKLSDEITDLEQQINDHKEVQDSASEQLQSLRKFGSTLDATETSAESLASFVKLYNTERARLYEMHKESEAKLRTLRKDLEKKRKQKQKLGRATVKAKAKKSKAKMKKDNKKWKKNQAKARRAAEKRDEKNRKKIEKRQGRPTHSLQVKILIESSRHEEEASLKMSYIVRNAGWIPKYDLKLSSVTSKGKIIYKAELKNSTWESWKDAKIQLSTSATTFTGLFDTVPTLPSWNVKLGKSNAFSASDQTKGLYSLREQQAANDLKKGNFNFGPAQSKGAFYNNQSNAVLQQRPAAGGLFGSQQQQQQQQETPFGQPRSTGFGGGSLFGAGSSTNTGFGSSNTAPTDRGLFGAPRASGGFGAPPPPPPPPPAPVAAAPTGAPFRASALPPDAESNAMAAPAAAVLELERGERLDSLADRTEALSASGIVDDDVSTLMGERAPMAVAESTAESHGMTTTYDLPGLRTVVSSTVTSRVTISKIELSGVEFTCVIVPKLRPAAFLKARIRNSSKITLLRGSAALTLDGSFLGTTTIPKVNGEQYFSLSLGTDTGITVTYAKPTRKSSSQGVFNKEETTLYTRSVFLHNAKPSPVDVQVLDQVPTSENERLRINIVTPKGLKSEGDTAKVPTSSVLVSKRDADGDAASVVSSSSSRGGNRSSIIGSLTGKNEDGINVTASLKKAGEIQWDVKLEKGKMCRLNLEYEVKIPAGETIYAAN